MKTWIRLLFLLMLTGAGTATFSLGGCGSNIRPAKEKKPPAEFSPSSSACMDDLTVIELGYIRENR